MAVVLIILVLAIAATFFQIYQIACLNKSKKHWKDYDIVGISAALSLVFLGTFLMAMLLLKPLYSFIGSFTGSGKAVMSEFYQLYVRTTFVIGWLWALSDFGNLIAYVGKKLDNI